MVKSVKGSHKKLRKHERKNIVTGVVHISSTFNNTLITITSMNGDVVAWSNSGCQGFKGSRKSTPYAAQVPAEVACKKAMEHGLKFVSVEVRGPGTGRESAIRTLQAVGLTVTSIKDVTPIPHNGVKPRKKRRV